MIAFPGLISGWEFQMKKLLLVAGLVVISTAAQAQYGSSYRYGSGSNPQTYSGGGYTTDRGTYVQPYQATRPNNTQMDNYGTRGNVNPYTGQVGTRTPKW